MTFMREKITYTLENADERNGEYIINDNWIITTDTNLEVLCTIQNLFT